MEESGASEKQFHPDIARRIRASTEQMRNPGVPPVTCRATRSSEGRKPALPYAVVSVSALASHRLAAESVMRQKMLRRRTDQNAPPGKRVVVLHRDSP